jgi:hypothetical protein
MAVTHAVTDEAVDGLPARAGVEAALDAVAACG